MCKHYGLDEVAEYWHQVVKINDYQKSVLLKNYKSFGRFDNKNPDTRLAFKANTNDSRESAAIYVTEKLFEAGAEIKIYDPKVPKSKISNDIFEYWQLDPNRLKNKIEISEIKNFKNQFDVIAILTEWENFKCLDFGDSFIFDGRNLLKQNSKNYKGV